MTSFARTARRPSRRLAGTAAGGLTAIVLLCACHGTQTAAGLPGARQAQAVNAGSYVALGDSYTSAPLVPDQDGIPAGCLRSSEDYPALVARALHTRSLTDVSCYGASTRNMTHPQDSLGHGNPPQLSAVSAADSLVTVQVGGDDVGFSRILATCGALSLTDPFGSPCRDHYTAGGTDQLAQAVSRTAPKVATVLRDVRARAPHARILLIGYPVILPASGSGCWPWVPIAHGDVPYLRSVEISLNAMLAAVAARAGAGYVDAYRGTVGHDACQPAGVKWVEGLIPSSLAVPLHPNASGEKAVARLIVAAVR